MSSITPKGLSFFESLMARYLSRLRGGTLRLELTSGRVEYLGDGEGPEVDMKILDAAMPRRLVLGGSMALGEGYVNGAWTTSDLSALLTLLARNQHAVGRIRNGLSIFGQWLDRLYHWRRSNTLEQSKSNIEAHYDLSNDFYALFLDRTMTYSSALFESREEDSLETGQERKIGAMLRRAACPEGGHLLEIGTGWGALALRAARAGCRVTSLTLSKEQLAYAKDLIEGAGFKGQVDLRLQDYRDEKGEYDAVVSCEMIEAVGREFLPTYFKTIRDCLKPGGRAVVQAITISDDRYAQYSRSCDWIQRYIFPGGHLPSKAALREIVADLGGMELEVTESFGLDYAETLRRWRDAFNERETELEALGFDAPFRRKWNYYLSYCEAGFEAGSIDVSQIVLNRSDR
ncbi:MAG: methyltransferase domain-containing protein [Verrucomicrobia bacterium]|nr:methyltransferase domain-containing protein [Verrucomicrobiota bacterium]